MQGEQPDSRQFAQDFRVGDWLVEPSLDRLSRNGTVVRLRPQLIDVLVLLARHAGRTVSKDLLLETVWQSQHVAESCMTRCIAEIRQALADDAREPTILQTIPKRGYRLVAPVEFLESPRPAATERETADRTAPRWPDASAPEFLPPHSSRPIQLPHRNAIGAIAAIVLGSLLVATFGAGSGSTPPALSEGDSVLLADVTNTTGDGAFDGTLRLALGVSLGQAPSLRILSRERVRSALTRMGRPADLPLVGPVALEVCRREGAVLLLAGSIARLGSHYAVGLEATSCATGESIDRQLLEVGNKDEVLTAVGTAATRVRRALGESPGSLRQYDVPLARATTPSLEALKALSLGDYNRDHARLGDALMFYRRATELDPQFAVAWARRAMAARNLSEFAEAGPAFRKAYELRDRASDPERFYIVAHYYRFVEDDPAKAVETYKLWKRTYPGASVPPTNLASLYGSVFGQYEAAVAEARDAVRFLPQSSIAHGAMVAALLGTGNIPAAKTALREAAARGATDMVWHGLAFQVAFLEDDPAGMNEHIRWASDDAGAAMQINQYRALAAAATGRLGEARQRWAEALATAAQIGPPAWQAGIKVTEAGTEALVGDPRRARAAAEAALALDQRPFTVLFASMALAAVGEVDRAAALLDRFDSRPDGGLCLKRVWLAIGRALVEAGSGRPERAREILQQAAPFERGRDFALVPLGVRASIEASSGRPAQAAAAYQELLRLRGVAPVSPWVAVARLGLARALRESGDLKGSRAAYEALIESMKGADADAPLLVAARRERDAVENR